jgi:hypothetical protein
VIVIAKAEVSVQPEDGRQRGRDQEEIIEMTAQERPADLGDEEPSVEDVEQARHGAERIEEIPEPPHSSAKMIQPVASAIMSLPRNNITGAF